MQRSPSFEGVVAPPAEDPLPISAEVPSSTDLAATFMDRLARLKDELASSPESAPSSTAVDALLARAFDDLKMAAARRERSPDDARSALPAQLVQGMIRVGSELPPATREPFLDAWVRQASPERLGAILGVREPPVGTERPTGEYVRRVLGVQADLAASERAVFPAAALLAWDAAFQGLEQGAAALDPAHPEFELRVREEVGRCWERLQESEEITGAIGETSPEAVAEAVVLKAEAASTRLASSNGEALLAGVFSRLPNEAVAPLILQQRIPFSVDLRRRLIRKTFSRLDQPVELLAAHPAFTEGISTSDLIEDIAVWDVSKAFPLLRALPEDEALRCGARLAVANPHALQGLFENFPRPEQRDSLAGALLDERPREFLRVAAAMADRIPKLAERKLAFLGCVVGEKQGEGLSLDHPFDELEKRFGPLSDEECVFVAAEAVRVHLLNFERYLKDGVKNDALLTRMKALPEEGRWRIAEAGLTALPKPDPALFARLSRYFSLPEAVVSRVRQRYPELATTNYLNPAYAGILGGLALRPYDESPRPDRVEIGPDPEQVLAETERIGTRLTELMKQAVPDRAASEDARAEQERLLRQPIRYEADLGIGVASSLVVVFERDDEPAIYKPCSREAKENPIGHGPIRHGIKPGESAIREWLAVQIDKVFQLDVVPPTVLRVGSHGLGSVQKWEKGRMPGDPKADAALTPANVARLALFDVIARNTDRHSGNLLVTEDGAIRGIDHGYILSRTSGGPDGLRSHPLEKIQGAPVPSELRAKIRLFKQSPDLQSGLREAFALAFPGDGAPSVDRLWGEFLARLDLLDPSDPATDGIFPVPDYH